MEMPEEATRLYQVRWRRRQQHLRGLHQDKRNQTLNFLPIGFSFAKLLASPGLRLDQQIHDADKLDAEAKALYRAECHAVPLPPFHEAAILAEAFFDEVQWQYPFLHKASFLSSLREVYNAKSQGQDESRAGTGSDAANIRFQIFLVLAVGASTLSKTPGMAADAGNYYISAMQYSDRALYNVSLVTTQNHLLLAMYALFNPRSDTNIWFINYLLMASCIDLGLHRDVGSRQESLPKEAILKEEMRKRVFWSCYCLDRNVGTALGRPLGIRNEACDVPLPSDFDDDYNTELCADRLPKNIRSAAALGTSETSHLNSMHAKSFDGGESITMAEGTATFNSDALSNSLSQDSQPLGFTPMSPPLSNDQFMTTLGLENFPFEPLHDDGGIQTPNMALDITDWSSWETLIPNWESIFPY
ncbi:transcriptional regulator family: Fungal Specific TF [Trichoderma harzianum]|nr:transcriptional regulator family: Fungal Specific TF [Trichoderma harzianum]